MAKTEENLKTAFAGESQARNKYDFFAKVARNEGYHYIAKFFEETAKNEMQHAKEEFKLLNGLEIQKPILKKLSRVRIMKLQQCIQILLKMLKKKEIRKHQYCSGR